MTTTVCTPNPTWTASAVVEGYAVSLRAMSFRGRHLAAFGIDKTQGTSAWRPPDW